LACCGIGGDEVFGVAGVVAIGSKSDGRGRGAGLGIESRLDADIVGASLLAIAVGQSQRS
jgi:hypothetical protein